MFRLISRAQAHGRLALAPRRVVAHRYNSSKASDPLRILFCGSDAFSCESLRALHREHVHNRALIEALDVMVLPGKRTGRGLKTVRQVPCKDLAEELDLPVHQRETFRQWELPRGTNLVVVVSFGLFVPPRILKSSKYGGLNVHPSLLPDLRGPAPIHHALLRGDTHIGVSLQTLDHRAFDHGTILAQSPAPGMSIAPDALFPEVLSAAAKEGAEMLIRGLRDGVHVPPLLDVGWKAAELEGKQLVHAPKVTKADGRIHWSIWTADQFATRVRVLGSVWTLVVNEKSIRRRILFLDAEPVADGLVSGHVEHAQLVCEDETVAGKAAERHHVKVVFCEDGSCLVDVCHGSWVRVGRVKVEGKPEQIAAVALKSWAR